MFSHFIASGTLVLLTLVFGVWLSLSSKPYNGLLFNIHKLIALSAVVVTVVQISWLLKGTTLQVSPIVLFIVAGLCVVALFFSGAMMSAGKLDYQVMLTIHKIALILIPIVVLVIVCLLAGSHAVHPGTSGGTGPQKPFAALSVKRFSNQTPPS